MDGDKFFGAKILGGDMPPPPPRTETQVLLKSTGAELSAVVNQNNEVMHYQLTLTDHIMLVTYIYRFNEDIRRMFEAILAEMPRVGETIPDDE